ncbi:MAG: YlmC/YmxH family sporulation protein [Anaerovoracaceae bacterium]|jgi:YlmC/YmxH family sporulation protein
MINTQDIRDKEVINIYDGKSLGFVYDIEIDLEKGVVEGIVVPTRRRLLQFVNPQDDHVIRWKDIRRIGADVVLVDLPGIGGEITYDRDHPPMGYPKEEGTSWIKTETSKSVEPEGAHDHAEDVGDKA